MIMKFNEDRVWCPPVELVETSTALILKVEIPGVKIQDLDVRTTENSVAINGKRRLQNFAHEKELIASQMHYGDIKCTVKLPVSIQNERVEAELIDGILTVTMPKVRDRTEMRDWQRTEEEFALFLR
jgi:HSP20 family protein